MTWTAFQLACLCLVLAVGFLLQRLATPPSHEKLPKDDVWAKLDIVGIPTSGILRWPRALAQSVYRTKTNVHEGYERFCKAHSRPFALPTLWTGGAVVVLPQSQLHLLNRPDGEITGFKALLDTIQLPYMIGDRDVYENVIHFDVVRKRLKRKDVGSLAAATAEEIERAFHESWPNSSQWTPLYGWDGCGRIITRSTLRILIGLPLSRNDALMKTSQQYANSLFAGTAIINCIPPLLRPFIGPLVALPTKYYQRRCQEVLVPFVRERTAIWRKLGEEGDEVPNDFLQWLIARASQDGPKQMDPYKIAMRLLALNTMFIFAMGYVFAHSVFDLYGSSSSNAFAAGLEEECRRVKEKHGNLSTEQAVDSLFRIDSAVRESMRISDVGITTLPRDVITGHVDLGNGIRIPPGVRMVFPSQPMHLDSRYHEDPLSYDAFRFSRKFESRGQASCDERELLTSVGPSFLAFGYGRHVCPGRWFVAQTIKQALAYVVSNYHIEMTGEPVQRKALLNMMVPPTGTQIRVRQKISV